MDIPTTATTTPAGDSVCGSNVSRLGGTASSAMTLVARQDQEAGRAGTFHLQAGQSGSNSMSTVSGNVAAIPALAFT